MPALSSAETQPEDTRSRMIAAALQLFGQVGYARAATRAIAEAAGVNEVTLFRHFGSKKNLLLACAETFNASGFAANFEKELTGNYAEDLLWMARLQIRSTAENLHFLRLMLSDARAIPEMREAMLTGARGNMARLSAYFQRQIEAGVIRPEFPAEALATAFDNLFSSNVIFENLFEDSLTPQLPAEETTRALAALFVRGTIVNP